MNHLKAHQYSLRTCVWGIYSALISFASIHSHRNKKYNIPLDIPLYEYVFIILRNLSILHELRGRFQFTICKLVYCTTFPMKTFKGLNYSDETKLCNLIIVAIAYGIFCILFRNIFLYV